MAKMVLRCSFRWRLKKVKMIEEANINNIMKAASEARTLLKSTLIPGDFIVIDLSSIVITGCEFFDFDGLSILLSKENLGKRSLAFTSLDRCVSVFITEAKLGINSRSAVTETS